MQGASRMLVALTCASFVIVGQQKQLPNAGDKKTTAPKQVPTSKAASPKSDRRLSLDQIRQLIVVGTPDAVIVQEIQSRGLRTEPSRKEIDQLRQQGAGTATVSALQRLVPISALTVITEPGASVKLDSGPTAVAHSDGTIVFSNLDPGDHQLRVEKRDYKPVVESVTLKANETAKVEAKLEQAFGYLTVTTNVPDAQIQVLGARPEVGKVTRLSVPVGAVNVTVTASLRKPRSETIAIEPGKETTLSVTLMPDESAISALAEQIHAAYRAQRYRDVLQDTARYRQITEVDKDVLADVAMSNFRLSRYDDFKRSAQDALQGGSALRFMLWHHHLDLGIYTRLHQAVIELTSKSLHFRPMGPCNLEPFEIPLSRVRVETRNVAIMLAGNQTGWSVGIHVPNPKNPTKEVTLNFVAERENPDRAQTAAIRDLIAALTR